MKNTPKIFISYCHKDSEIVDTIENDLAFVSTDIRLIRDKRDYKDYSSLDVFMKGIKTSDFAILIVSKYYFESFNCMKEIVKLLEKDNFKDIIFPIVKDDFNIYNSETSSKCKEYWINEYTCRKNKIDYNHLEFYTKETVDLQIITKIQIAIDNFITAIHDLKSPSLKILQDKRYKAILEKIGISDNVFEAQLLKISEIKDEEEQDIEIDNLMLENQNYLIYYFKAIIESKRNNHKKAINFYTHSLNLNSQNVTLYNNRGIVYFKIGKTDAALNDFSKAIEIDSSYADSYFNIGLVYFEKADFSSSLKYVNKAIELNPVFSNSNFIKDININPNSSKTYFIRAEIFYKIGQLYNAINDISKAIKIEPTKVEYFDKRSSIYFSLKDYDSAINDLTHIIELEPNFPKVYFNRGNVYHEKGKIIMYGYMEKGKKNLNELNDSMTFILEIKEWNLAINDLSKAIELDSEKGNAYFIRGTVFGIKQDWYASIADLTKAIEINPNFKDAYKNRAIAYLSVGETKKYSKDMEKYYELKK